MQVVVEPLVTTLDLAARFIELDHHCSEVCFDRNLLSHRRARANHRLIEKWSHILHAIRRLKPPRVELALSNGRSFGIFLKKVKLPIFGLPLLLSWQVFERIGLEYCIARINQHKPTICVVGQTPCPVQLISRRCHRPCLPRILGRSRFGIGGISI